MGQGADGRRGDQPAQLPLIVALGLTQTLAWASSYYIPAVLADPIAHDLGLSTNWIFAAFSGALVISGLIGPRVGRQIDLVGGRWVLGSSNFAIAGGLVALGLSHGLAGLVLAWVLLGLGMGLGLYDAAFSALGRIYGDKARRPITGITLFAGFASTIGWPLSVLGLDLVGWRGTCFAWAALHVLLALPTHLLMLPRVPAGDIHPNVSAQKPHIPMDRAMLLLAFAFAAAWTVTGAMAAHLPRILMDAGATRAQAIAAGALIGPAQVGARIVEATFLSRYHPVISTRLSCATHPLGALAFALFGVWAAGLFAFLHGAGNGILTIARGTLPLAIFGPRDYGYRLGLLGAPSRVAQAISPLLFGLLIDRLGAGVLVISSALSLFALGALMFVPRSETGGT